MRCVTGSVRNMFCEITFCPSIKGILTTYTGVGAYVNLLLFSFDCFGISDIAYHQGNPQFEFNLWTYKTVNTTWKNMKLMKQSVEAQMGQPLGVSSTYPTLAQPPYAQHSPEEGNAAFPPPISAQIPQHAPIDLPTELHSAAGDPILDSLFRNTESTGESNTPQFV